MVPFLTLFLLLISACGSEPTESEAGVDSGSDGESSSGGAGGTTSLDSSGGGAAGAGGTGGTSSEDAAEDGSVSAETGIDAPELKDAATCGDAGRADCDTSTVTCRSLPPPCPAGQLPAVSGSCWAGCCVKASACRSVKDCSVCSRDTYVCASDHSDFGLIRTRCADITAACANDRTCTCLRQHMCVPFGFYSCSESTNGFEFSCFNI
jgi:hypothetical protein